MICFARNLKNLFLALPFCLLIIFLVLGMAGITALPLSACCYDPPDNGDVATQAEQSTDNLIGEAGQDSEDDLGVPEEAQRLRYSTGPSEQSGQTSSSAGVEHFLLIRRYMADGQYLRAKQIAEKQLMTRPFDYRLWGLLENIYRKMGLQNKTVIAAKNAEAMNPRRRPSPQTIPPMLQQKRYVARLLQAIGEYKPIE